jgi:transposase InsO family protein
VLEVCEIFGVSRKTYYKWYNKDCGPRSHYRNKREHPNLKMTNEVKKFVQDTKKQTNYGPLKMQMLVKKELGIDLSTTIIYRYYKRRGLIRKPQKKQPWYTHLKEPLYITSPGIGVQLDIKYVYKKGTRYYQFSVLDPFTRLYHAYVLPTKHAQGAIKAIREAQISFGFSIHSVQTDNGSEFRGDFHHWCQKNAIDHFFIPKSSPIWNGKVERIHKTLDDEFYQNPLRTFHALQEWIYYYNTERLHIGLKGLTPHEKLIQFRAQKCNP